MALADIQTSLNAGELSPQLYARVDLDKFQTGAALLRNFFVDYRGGVSNRPGTKYIATVEPNSRLIPFVVSTSTAYVLVFSDLLITIFTAGELVTTVSVPYLAADLFTIAYTQSADVLTLVHPSYPPANLSRTSDTTFEYAVLTTAPSINPPVVTTMVAPHPGPYSFGYLVTAVDGDGKEESLPSNPAVKHSEGMNELTNRVVGLSWTAPVDGSGNPQSVVRYNIYKWGPIDAVTLNPATVWGFIGSSQTTTFVDNNIAADFSKQPPGWGDPFSGGQFQSITVNNGGSGYDGVSGDWPVIPYVPLAISGDGTGAAGYAVIDHATGKIIGVYMTNPGKNYTTATITANGEGGSGATFKYTFTDPAALNPAATAYIQQRRVFAGSNLKPETVVMSQTGLYNNFNTTPISLASDAIVMSIAGEQVNTIKALVSVSYGLLTFTTGGSFLISGGSPGAPISPETVAFQVQASEGANNLRPLTINYDVLYGQAKGNRIRNLAFAWQRQSYTGSDISTLAAHLFDTFHTVDWTWAEEPFKLVWAVRDDGKLLSLTYVPDQEVYAWCRHDTFGLFKSVCSIPEGDTNAVYVLVQRSIPQTDDVGCCDAWAWYLERFMERQGCCIFDSWFLDSAVEYAKTPGFTTLCIENVNLNNQTATLHPCTSPDTLAQGSVIQFGCALFTVLGVNLDGTYAVSWTGDFSEFLLPNGKEDSYRLIDETEWTWNVPTAVIEAPHLVGQETWALADGRVEGPLTDTGDGTFIISAPSSSVVLGLKYTAQVKTLYLTVDNLQPGSNQGKRKLVPAVTLRVDCSKGLTIGQDFDNLTEVPDLNAPILPANTLFTGDARTVIGAAWDERGEVCVQQDAPVPTTILGIIVEVTPGDTGR